MKITSPALQTGLLTLLPEWAEQEAVILAWPHKDTDWKDNLDDARACYVKLIYAINDAGAAVILLCPSEEVGLVRSVVSMQAKVLIVEAEYNDTWARDFTFLSCETANGNTPVNFIFNGWGQKFDAAKDNQINQTVLAPLCQRTMVNIDTVLEGGAIEIDQNQHLLSTTSCLLNPQRNGKMSLEEYRSLFANFLGSQHVTIFEDGHLEGDDTDGHIDTLVRFTPLHSIVIQGCFNRPNDNHFGDLFKLKYACEQSFPTHQIFELPLPYLLNDKGERLPASYANFLICNRHILFPVYQQPEDQEALEIIEKAFPNHKIQAIDCSTLVQQYGSLHCVTMQVPIDTLKTEVINRAKQGVSVL
ncbi:agmatine deiminase family protein [Glaciecola sp. KUL10]|uniref:agmatine deiminase family protein n=1 Tax=Glaciecola sp. (strain KUL10) TaxID=2161813 RepID=UPI000D78247F|nr:agmatine deiminase family protein [Glaciecola sp. KUL10]GBL05011.1 peptidyl-arginine deiminase [Glaciecola sp. KUL10]